ncbi:MAG: hypothetical protein R3C10_19180 [Pirellulales bacterium]
MRFIVILAVLYLTATWWLAAREGYLSSRHLAALVPATVGWAWLGAEVIAAWITANWPTRRSCHQVAAMCVVAALAICLPRTAAPQHASRAPHRQAGRWLADTRHGAGAVLDSRGWTGLYSDRATYAYNDAAFAFADPGLAFVVVERREIESESQRARTLRRLLGVAAEPVASFTTEDVRHQRDVLLYRWHGERLDAALAAHPTPPTTR